MAKKACLLLLEDAREQKRIASWFKGVLEALFSFRPSHRRPISRAGWKRLLELIEEDKNLAL